MDANADMVRREWARRQRRGDRHAAYLSARPTYTPVGWRQTVGRLVGGGRNWAVADPDPTPVVQWWAAGLGRDHRAPVGRARRRQRQRT